MSSTFEMEGKYDQIFTLLLKQMTNKNDIKVRVAVMKTFSVLALVMLDSLEKYYDRLIPHMQASAADGNNDLITYSLNILHLAFPSTDDMQKTSATARTHAGPITGFLCAIASLQS